MSKFNRISLLKKVKNNTPEVLCIAAILLLVLLLSFKVNIFIALIFGVFAFLLSFRLFFAKLKLRPGDVIEFWGPPGSGKTMVTNYVAAYNKRHGWTIVGNEEFCETSNIADLELPRRAFGWFKCPEYSVICTDEASLNGWDSRNWQHNFDDKNLAYWKKIRHYKNAAILTNQGFNELDSKIRDGLVKYVYFCENHGRYIKAIRMDKTVTFSEVTGLPQDGYSMPSIWQRLFDPSCVIYCWCSRAGKLYGTYNPDPLPDLADMDQYEYHNDKKRGAYWTLRSDQQQDP